MYALKHERLCDGILTETELIIEAFASLGPDVEIPTCPGWRTGQLLTHLHQALTWGATIVERRATEFLPPDAVQDGMTEPGPGVGASSDSWARRVDSLVPRPAESDWDSEDRCRWLRSAAERLVAALREAGPHAAVWTTFGAREARFWSSWAFAEVAVHRADIDLVRGVPVKIEADLATDALDLWLHAIAAPSAAMFFDPRLSEMRGEGETFSFRALDAPLRGRDAWLVTRTSEGLRTERPAPASAAPADVTVEGSAQELLLILKRRVPVERTAASVTGRGDLFAHWLRHVLT